MLYVKRNCVWCINQQSMSIVSSPPTYPPREHRLSKGCSKYEAPFNITMCCLVTTQREKAEQRYSLCFEFWVCQRFNCWKGKRRPPSSVHLNYWCLCQRSTVNGQVSFFFCSAAVLVAVPVFFTHLPSSLALLWRSTFLDTLKLRHVVTPIQQNENVSHKREMTENKKECTSCSTAKMARKR